MMQHSDSLDKIEAAVQSAKLQQIGLGIFNSQPHLARFSRGMA